MTVGQERLIGREVELDHVHDPVWDRKLQIDLVLDGGGGDYELVPRVIHRKGTAEVLPPIEAAQIFEA